MKTKKVSYKEVLEYAFKNECKIISVYNYELTNFFRAIKMLNDSSIRYQHTNYYSAGKKGWNCDYYSVKLATHRKNIIIASGIRASAKFEQLHDNLIEILENKSFEIIEKIHGFKAFEKMGFDYKADKAKLANELEKLAYLAFK